jgi:O-antigen/teichoic acid export membrane protein
MKMLLKFLRTSIPLLPMAFFSWIIQSSDSYFLAYFKGEVAVGKYSVIYSLANIILLPTVALNYFWFPVSVRLWKFEKEKYKKVFVSVFAGIVVILFIAVGFFELNARILMKILVRHPEYHDAYNIIGIIAFAFSMQVLITLLTAPLYSNHNMKTLLLSYIIGGIFNTLFNYLLIPSIGVLGAAFSTAVSYLIIVVFMSHMNYKIADFYFIDRRLIPLTFIFIFTWGGIAWIRDLLNLYQLLLVNIVFLGTAITLLYFKVLTVIEREYLYGMYSYFRLKKVGNN